MILKYFGNKFGFYFRLRNFWVEYHIYWVKNCGSDEKVLARVWENVY